MGRTAGISFEKALNQVNLTKWYCIQKLSQVDIAKKVGCTKSRVGQQMKFYGVPVRKVQEFVRLGIRKSPMRKHQKLSKIV